jgi:hypothetical protein
MGKLQKVRPEPRISSAKLGDYMAEPRSAVRLRILRDQKIKPDAQVAWYRRAVAAMRDALIAIEDPSVTLAKAIIRIQKSPTSSKWQADDANLSAECIRHFARFLGKFNRKGLTFGPIRADAYRLAIEGVEISVYPIARIGRTNKDGTRSTGAILGIQRKAVAVSERAGTVTAELVRMALERSGSRSYAVCRRRCVPR